MDMVKFSSAIMVGFTSFVATNIDDIIILILLFTQTNSLFRPKHIFIGQYLGFSILVLASLPGFLGGLLIPTTWVGLLGFLPIWIGISQLIHQSGEVKEIQVISSKFSESTDKLPILPKLMSLIAPQTYQVAAITIANGGDNVGIYIPLFASSDGASLSIILIVFLGLIGMWCYIARHLTLHRMISKLFSRYGHAIAPIVFIGLGMFIFLESKTYQLLLLFR